jgi:hypothetical protein
MPNSSGYRQRIPLKIAIISNVVKILSVAIN